MTEASARSLTRSLDKLRITPPTTPIADSWEDEDNEVTNAMPSTTNPKSLTAATNHPSPPPPTPSSPKSPSWSPTTKESVYQTFPPHGMETGSSARQLRETSNAVSGRTTPRSPPTTSTRDPLDEDRRPDKSTSVASRLIAAGIGQKAPKRTKEQREYDQAMKVQEKKRRDEVKAAEETKRREAERARAAIWED